MNSLGKSDGQQKRKTRNVKTMSVFIGCFLELETNVNDMQINAS